mgnify:CR=1 FL=1
MKFTSSQLAYLMGQHEMRANLRALLKYLVLLVALVTLYAVLFHVIKVRVEGEQHSWITGFYWTLVVMTTLGFGDITFTSDIGRLFSIVVLLSGVFCVDATLHREDGRWWMFANAAPGGSRAQHDLIDQQLLLVRLATEVEPQPRDLRPAPVHAGGAGHPDLPGVRGHGYPLGLLRGCARSAFSANSTCTRRGISPCSNASRISSSTALRPRSP